MGWCADIAVEVEDLRINHGKCPLVRVSHLQIRFGERVAVIGRSGAGKSLLAGALTGTVPATVSVTGKITLAGHIRGGEAVTGISGALFGTVAFARQDSADALNPLVSITDQLAIPLRRRGLRGPDAHDAAHRLLAGIDYLERAWWTVGAPTLALVLASVLAVPLSALPKRGPKPSPEGRHVDLPEVSSLATHHAGNLLRR